ncbi:MAG: hypothetical protein RL660_2315 [Bacteroidota bacterium]|jgi:predicted nucleotidyltransferase
MHYLDVHNNNKHVLLRVISGSIAYGLNTATSDTDIRGVFVLPQADLYGLHYTDQCSDEKNDIVYYELRKVVQLLLRNNPNTLDLIATPADCILYKHPLMDKLSPDVFLSKLCYQSFAGYAQTQIQRARGLNKKILNPMDKERKGLLDFCWVSQGQGSIALKVWLQQNQLEEKQCGCAAIDHMKNCYHLFAGDNYTGIVDRDNVQIKLSSVAKNEAPRVMFYCNTEGFQKYCLEYNEYWKWVDNRNEARYESTLEHGKQYDAKNMMHTFRLLNMAHEIALEAKINVRRHDRGELLKIRSGHYTYEDLVARANDKLLAVKEAFDSCALPEQPDEKAVNGLLGEMREVWYGQFV